ncbi:MAG: hypothetical protein ACREDZ_17795, partial [Kiloniellales bacterium]
MLDSAAALPYINPALAVMAALRGLPAGVSENRKERTQPPRGVAGVACRRYNRRPSKGWRFNRCGAGWGAQAPCLGLLFDKLEKLEGIRGRRAWVAAGGFFAGAALGYGLLGYGLGL